MATKNHLRHLFTAMLTMTFIVNATAQTTLPNFRTADNFGGQTVENLEQFVPTPNNFTLEMDVTGGTEISLGFSQVGYTPSADGKVRFVQQDGVIYVFENNAYTTKLTPSYNYTEIGNNLIRNGSFETVTEQLTSGRWIAADWETWDGGTPTWGGDVQYVNVRENESKRSDGMKSIILHSRSKWLCQHLTAGALEAGAAYCLTCDYWTSDGAGNGNGVYELWLGSSLATNDLLTIEGYTTLEGDYSKHSFSTIFQMPSTFPSDLYLSFYRDISKVDWLDNVRLIKIQTEGMGITGVLSATYTTGAYAPQSMTLPEGVSIDMTGSMVNPNFDDGSMTNSAPFGWMLDAAVTQSKISTGEKSGLIAADQNHWQLWQSSGALTGRAYQTMTSLPSGRYVLAADVVTTGFGGTISLYANYGTAKVLSGAAKRYVVEGIVTNGTLEVGLALSTTGGVTIDFDNFTLMYEGMDMEGYREVLALKVTEANQVLANLEDGYDPAPINNAVSKAQSIGSDADADTVIAAIAAIDNALADYQLYADQRAAERKNLENFRALVAAAKTERNTKIFPGTTDFDKAIEEAEAFLADLETDISLPVSEHADALNAAREAYYNSQYTISPSQQTVSYVDLSLSGSEKYVLRVDGKPFYGTEIQVRPDKLRGYEGWSEKEIEAAFKRAALDGFNTLSIPLFWSEVEPEKNHFDWNILDTYLNWCKKYGVKAEILWFSWSSGGRVQWLWNGTNGRYQLRTPDYVCSVDGTSEFNMLRTQWEYSLDWRDQNLINREKFVLGKVMEHIALWDVNNDNPHTVIGVQLGNEARAHGGNSATAAEIINFYHQVGAAVKQSKYVTWTRLNCVSYETSGRTSANESKRNNGGTNIDFVGIDVYGTSAGNVKGDVSGQLGTNGKNYRMIMEIDAKDSNSPLYQMAALAGNKAFDYYNLGPVDGNGLYGNNGHVLSERSHVALVRQRNKILNLANQDIALRSQGNGLYVYNYAGSSTASETGLAGITFVPNVSNTQAIAVRHSESQIALLSTSTGTFTIPSSLNVTSAQKGYFDTYNRWVKEDDVIISDNTIVMPATSCVLITLDGKEDENDALVVNGEFNNGTFGWTNTTNAQTYKVSTIAKGDGSVITADGGHLQLWSGSSITGQVFQDIALPNGTYTLTCGCFATFGGTVTMFANDEQVEIKNNKNAYYSIDVEVTDGTLRIGLDVKTNGGTDIEWDHVTLTPKATLKGDVNHDGFIDISDIVAIINTIAGTAEFEDADVNGDEKSDISDIVAVINIIAGL